jgi:hypothetical protein
MIIVVEGTKTFSNYETFMRAMGVALSNVKDGNIEVWSAGPHNINNYTAAFCNITENYLRQKGIRISFKKLHRDQIEKKIGEVSYFAFFSSKKESMSKLAASAELNGVETEIFRY